MGACALKRCAARISGRTIRAVEMDITVAICTWNRADLLDQTLEGMRRLKIPAGISWELIVVNNNCSDNTDAIIEKHLDLFPLKRVFERQQGLSNARNAAVRHAQGRYILWTDDDVLVDPEWLAAYITAFERWPDAAVFGGKVLPWFEAPPPFWLKRHLDLLGCYFALRDFGDADLILQPGQNPYGANMAYRGDILRKHIFNPALGRNGDSLVSGEDSQVINKIRDEGGTVVWTPSSTVLHFLPKKRMTLGYLRRLHYSSGRHEVGALPDPKNCIAGYPLWLLKRLLVCEVGFYFGIVFKPNSFYWLDKMIKASSLAGQLAATKHSQKM